MTDIERCQAEIARCEADLRAGHPEVEGLYLGLADWSAELRILQRPICIDLFCGLGGWTEGFLAEGYTVIGFDNHRHEYGDQKYLGQLVIQDVLTLHGSQFKNAAVIVASPPCQNYSYLAMPWSRSTNPENSKAAKVLRLKWETEGPDNRLFDACFRIQREASEAGGRYIPLIVENVRGAIPWVGRSAWNYGSFHLWGDVPALMPIGKAVKAPGQDWNRFRKTGEVSPDWKFQGVMVPGGDALANLGIKVASEDGGRRTDVGKGARFTSRDCGIEGTKQPAGNGDCFSKDARAGGSSAALGSKSSARKAASAQIAKIPLPLAQHIAQVYFPRNERAA